MPVIQKHPSAAQPTTDESLSLPEVISALSFAIDLTEGAVPGHALRTCILGMRIARRAGLPSDLLGDLYFALLLKDIGCSSNAARVSQIVGGDDRVIKAGIKFENWTARFNGSRSNFRLFWGAVLPDADPVRRLLRIARIAINSSRNNMELIALRCERGAKIIRKLGFNEVVADAVRSLDEHWDGGGYPRRLVDGRIPIAARVLAVAQHLDVFATARSPSVALEVLCERSNGWFDPELVQIAVDLDLEGTLWSGCSANDDHNTTLRLVRDLTPLAPRALDHQEIDRLCEAFADVVDAKSPFTYRHSVGVAEVALNIANTLGLSESRCQLVRRAALLHDLGKLSIPNTILDKSGDLTDEERVYVEEHPRLTRQILGRIRAFKEIADVAGAHHERLDGSGYPDHLHAADIPLETRILAVADIYRALTEQRPYRPALTHNQVIHLLRSDTPAKLDPEVVSALESCYKPQARRSASPPHHPAAGPISDGSVPMID